MPERALIIGQGLRGIAAVLADFPQGGQGAGVVGIDLQGLDQLVFGGRAVTQFLVESGQLDLGIGQGGLPVGPAFQEPHRVAQPAFLGQQDGQAAVATAMVRIAVEALVVDGFGLFHLVPPVIVTP